MSLRARIASLLPALPLCAAAVLAGPAGAQTVHAVTESTPFTAQAPDGRVAGAAAEIVERTLQRAGVRDYDLKLYPWPRSYALAQQEPGVLIFPMARTPEREKLFHWVAPIIRAEYRLFSLADRRDIQVASLADAQRYAIGVIRDDVRHLYLRRRGFVRLAVSADTAENFRRLTNRQVDMVVLSDAAARMLCEQAGADCPGVARVFTLDEIGADFYMAYSLQTDAALVQRTRAAYEALRTEGALSKLSSDGPRAGPPSPPSPPHPPR